MIVDVIQQSGRVLTQGEVTQVTLPTPTGIIQVLPNHANLITLLSIGQIVIKTGSGEDIRLATSGGIAKVDDKEIKLLVAQADRSEELEKDDIRQAVKNAEERISHPDVTPAELIQLEKQLRYMKFKESLLDD
jgi:F-type H+-transporting ATPase subunit epsilon